MKSRSYWKILLVSLMMLSLLAGCSAKLDAAYDAPEADYQNKVEMEAPQENYDSLKDSYYEDASTTTTGNQTQMYQKLIRRMEIRAETEDFDALLAGVENRVKEMGGYIQSKEIYRGSAYANRVRRSGNLTLRVPADKADLFVEKIGEVSNITSSSENTDDVTLKYVATESRMTALKTEEKRLLELLSKAADMKDLLLIEERLTAVRTELEEVTSQLRVYDNLVDYATVRLYIEEVVEYTTPTEEKTLWQRIGSGLSQNIKDLGEFLGNFLVFVITSLPYLLLIAAVVAVIVIAVKSSNKRRKKKAQEPPQQ